MIYLCRTPLGCSFVGVGVCFGRSGGLNLWRRGLRVATLLRGERWCGGYEGWD